MTISPPPGGKRRIALENALEGWWISSDHSLLLRYPCNPRNLKVRLDDVFSVNRTDLIGACSWGFHSSLEIRQAQTYRDYLRSRILFRTLSWGKVHIDFDKYAAEHRAHIGVVCPGSKLEEWIRKRLEMRCDCSFEEAPAYYRRHYFKGHLHRDSWLKEFTP